MIDCLCVAAPMKPSTTKFTTPVDGVFSQGVQKAFNAILPPDFSHQLSKKFTIGSADTSASTKSSLLSYVGKLNPYNHRMKELSHDPILGFIIGAKDIINNTCTIVENGKFTVYHSIKPNVFDGNFFHAMGQMFGHLASDINAPSAKGNRGMGLPAPLSKHWKDKQPVFQCEVNASAGRGNPSRRFFGGAKHLLPSLL